MEVSELLGLDVGKVKTGIARASSVAKLAEPLYSIETKNAAGKLKEIIKHGNVECLVVGLPRNLKSQDTPQTVWVRQWVDQFKAKMNIPMYWQDEALTSKIAKSRQLKAKDQKTDDHALAAAIILQDFLDSPETDKQPC